MQRTLSDQMAAGDAWGALLGRRWVPLVVRRLAERPMRFNELKTGTGRVSSKTLSATLRDLQHTGFVERRVLSARPLRVSYELTKRGRVLADVLCDLDALGSIG